MSESKQTTGKLGKAVLRVRAAVRSLTPVEAVEIAILFLWAIFLLVTFRACG